MKSGAQDTAGDLRDFNEIYGAGLSEDGLQFSGSVPEKKEAGADDLPIFFGVAGGREVAEGVESFVETGDF